MLIIHFSYARYLSPTAMLATMIRQRLTKDAWKTRAAVATNLALIAIVGLFAFVQVRHVVVDRVFTNVPFAFEYVLLVGLFLIRRRPTRVSGSPIDWALAATAWLPLLVQPTDAPMAMAFAGGAVGTVGALATLAAMGYLGRSFGIVAANRGIKTGGAYRYLRHPIYASESLALIGGAMVNPGLLNWMLIFVALVGLPLRIAAEERVLSNSDEYRHYVSAVRWRLMPGIY